MPTRERDLLLEQWLRSLYPESHYYLDFLHGDASFRSYSRLCFPDTGISFVVMDAPPPQENPKLFVRLADCLGQAGLCVPEVIHKDFDRGFLILSDFGDQTLLEVLNAQNAEQWYLVATDALLDLQQLQAVSGYNVPQFNGDLLRPQHEDTHLWFFERYLNLSLTDAEQRVLQNTENLWIQCIEEQPQVLMHRDYHSRNLMVITSTPAPKLGILDFQDLTRGPITHDLVSLWRDCYIEWPLSSIQHWVGTYYTKLHEKQLIPASVESAEFQRWFDWTGLQRHYRIAGTFARLWLRDHKPRYLDDLPRVLRYLQQASAPYLQLKEFHQLLQDRILPRFNEVRESMKESV